MTQSKPNMPEATRPTVLYVCAAARSGSTLTDMFMGGHSQAASLGELNFIGKAIRLAQECTCGSTVPTCTSWGQVFESLKKESGVDLRSHPYGLRLWDALASRVIDHQHQTRWFRANVLARKVWLESRDLMPAHLRAFVPMPPSLKRAVDNKIALYRSIAASWGKPVLIDSSKNQREAVELYKAWPDHVRIVLLMRDGRGVFLSQKKGGRDNAHSLSGWLNYYKRALPLLEKHVPPEALLRLHYEELTAAPEDTGRRLCAFAGIEYEPAMLDLSAGVRHMVNGNETRFSPGKGIRHDERWRTELDEADLRYFDQHGGAAMNRRLGYQ